MQLKTYISDETGAISLDWVVLSAALVGTGIAVMSTVTTGLDSVLAGTNANLSGEVIQKTFGGHYCPGGIEGVQTAENIRVADLLQAGLSPTAINAQDWMESVAASVGDAELLSAYDEIQSAGAAAQSVEATLAAIYECEMVKRGLL